MAVALVIGILDLVLELLAHTLGLGRALKTAGTITSRALKSLLDRFYDLFVFIQTNLHTDTPFAAYSESTSIVSISIVSLGTSCI